MKQEIRTHSNIFWQTGLIVISASVLFSIIGVLAFQAFQNYDLVVYILSLIVIIISFSVKTWLNNKQQIPYFFFSTLKNISIPIETLLVAFLASSVTLAITNTPNNGINIFTLVILITSIMLALLIYRYQLNNLSSKYLKLETSFSGIIDQYMNLAEVIIKLETDNSHIKYFSGEKPNEIYSKLNELVKKAKYEVLCVSPHSSNNSDNLTNRESYYDALIKNIHKKNVNYVNIFQISEENEKHIQKTLSSISRDALELDRLENYYIVSRSLPNFLVVDRELTILLVDENRNSIVVEDKEIASQFVETFNKLRMNSKIIPRVK